MNPWPRRYDYILVSVAFCHLLEGDLFTALPLWRSEDHLSSTVMIFKWPERIEERMCGLLVQHVRSQHTQQQTEETFYPHQCASQHVSVHNQESVQLYVKTCLHHVAGRKRKSSIFLTEIMNWKLKVGLKKKE